MTGIFVSGLPLTQDERTRVRAAVQANASRHRWQKAGFVGHQTSQRKVSKSGVMSIITKSNVQGATERRLARTSKVPQLQQIELPPEIFELPPPFPLGQPYQLSRDELWDMLQRCREVFQQIFPVDQQEGAIMAKDHMDRIISVELIFQAYMFSQAIRNLQLNSRSVRLRGLVSELHSQVVRTINSSMLDEKAACSDDTILAVCNLACHNFISSSVVLDTRARPEQGPLESLRLLDLYGGPIESVEVHLDGMLKMVELRGGLKALGLPGLGPSICLLEVIVASRELRPPRTDCMTCVDYEFDATLAEHRSPGHPLAAMASGFTLLSGHRLDHELMINLERLALYSLGVDSYVAGRPGRAAIGLIGDQRTFVQHNLLKMFQDSGDNAAKSDHSVTSLCHLAAMLYDFLCVFPMPAAPFETIVSRIVLSLNSASVAIAWQDMPELMTWVVFITAVAAVGLPIRKWLIAVLDRCFLRLKIYTWSEAKQLLQTFLWLPITNDWDGHRLWEAVQQSNPLQVGHTP